MKNKTAISLTAILVISIVFASASQIMLGFAESTPSPSWRTKTSMPTARSQIAVITGGDGLVYAMGGWAGVTPFTTVEAYDPLTETWSTKTAMPVATRGAAVAKAPNGIIYVIGGYSSNTLADVQAYNVTSDSWSTKTSIPVAVWMAGATAGDDGKIYVIGGEPPLGGETNATQIYNPSTDSWTTGASMPTARQQLGVVKAANGVIYAIGGYNGTALTTVEAYNPATNKWVAKASMPTPKLEFGSTLGPDNMIYVIGGGTSYGNNDPPFFDTVEMYDSRTDTWSTPAWSESFLPTARKELGATTGINGRIYAIGGANGVYLNTNEEAFIALPSNVPPTAYIDSISPNPTIRGQTISFKGHGSDPDGSVVAYKWRSSLNGTIGDSSTISLSTLIVGTHTIYFSVKDDSGAWSNEAAATVTVNVPISEDPTYQQLLNVNQTLNAQLTDLKAKSDSLAQANAALTNTVNGLTQKLDTMNLALLGLGIVIIVLLVYSIALTFLGKRKPATVVPANAATPAT